MKYPDITFGRVEAVWNKLGGEEGVARFLAGNAEVVVKNHVIDCDKQPYLPDGWEVAGHTRGGQLVWDASKVQLYLSDNQQNGKSIEGNKLRKELANKPVLNANVLDYLLANPHLIPEEWKADGNGNTRYIFFWGSIYRRSNGDLCVRCLYWGGDGWRWSRYWLGRGWRGRDPAALVAS